MNMKHLVFVYVNDIVYDITIDITTSDITQFSLLLTSRPDPVSRMRALRSTLQIRY